MISCHDLIPSNSVFIVGMLEIYGVAQSCSSAGAGFRGPLKEHG